MTNKGTLFVISAPSGCGKGTILSEVFKNYNNVFYSISATTRKPREGEKHGVNYYFMSKDEFTELINRDGFLEYAEYCNNMYGTPRKEVEEKLEQGYDVILEIETLGAKQVKEKFPDATLIFILPPSVKELRRRLCKRATEDTDVIEARLAKGVQEIKEAYHYDYIMVNDELSDAINDFTAIIHAAKLNGSKMTTKELIEEVLENA